MNYSLYLQTSAIEDLREAFVWYEEQKTGLGHELLSAATETLTRIEQSPLLFAKVFREKRRAALRRFPYNIIYEVEGDVIRVSAIMHGKKDPTKWKQRK
ncbi:MAG: type II toxin-antitoxin system RelE/ParE family toxin [Lewinellaceae bacterium]|nr:type II toxin-antitoxin system RelE/ParE family toxin [Saprospiraceae bacterium]MCB9337955.1 type II toxin-antitoxin system RelE/ParE family toxin [Lewinellaceae bacterium]